MCNPKEYIVQVFFLPLVIKNQPLKIHRQAKQNYSARAMVILYCQCKSSFVLLLKLQFWVMSKTFTSWLNLPTIRYKVFHLITKFSKTSISVPYQKQRYSVIMKQRDSPCCSNKDILLQINKQITLPLKIANKMHFFPYVVRCVLYPLMFLFEEMFFSQNFSTNSDLQVPPDDDVEDYVVQTHYLDYTGIEQRL